MSKIEPLFYTRFIKHDPIAEVNKDPSMTCKDLYLTTKQRVQSLLAAGQNLLAGRLGSEYFEQNGTSVNEDIKDTPLNDLHDFNVSARNLNEKFAKAQAKVHAKVNVQSQSSSSESVLNSEKVADISKN